MDEFLWEILNTKDPKSPVWEAAKQLYDVYAAFVKAGFTEEQAMELLVCQIKFTVEAQSKKEE